MCTQCQTDLINCLILLQNNKRKEKTSTAKIKNSQKIETFKRKKYSIFQTTESSRCR